MFSRKPSQRGVSSLHTLKGSSSLSDNGPLSPTASIPPTPGNEGGFYFSRQDLRAAPRVGASAYSRSQALEDLPVVRSVLHMFLGGKMLDAERLCKETDPNAERLYTTAGWGVIQSLKALMSFEDKDIAFALEQVKHAALIAGQHRRPSTSLAGRLAGLVVGSGTLGFIKGMTPVERHAELVYCECLLQKAILGIVSSGDWLTFIREFLNIRSATSVYHSLGEFVRTSDAEALATGAGPIDTSIDPDFRSGVSIGNGINSLVLTLLPDTVGHIAAIFGFKGDRAEALAMLRNPGGWPLDPDSDPDSSAGPGVKREDEGLRRSVADLVLLVFHLYISTITYTGVSIPQARSILDYNLGHYPSGVFFLFLQGRLNIMESRPPLGIQVYQRGMGLTEYKSLQGLAQWEVSLARFMLCDWAGTIEGWRDLVAEANWSKAFYTYALAVALYESGEEENRKEAVGHFAKVPTLTQKIGGKSIPIEKFASRKSRKYGSQAHRLVHPGIEISYMLSGLPHTPRRSLLSNQIPSLRSTLSTYASLPTTNQGYYDDLALTHLLHGVCLRYVAYPDPEAIETDEEKAEVERMKHEAGFLPTGETTTTEEVVGRAALESLQWVVDNGTKIELDHQLVYCAHLELGKLYCCLGNRDEAKRQLDLVASGKPLEVNHAGRKGGKYSMQNSIHIKSVSALEALEKGRRL